MGNASKNVPIHNTPRTCFVSQKKNDFFKIAKLLESDFIETKRDNNVMSQNDILFMKTIEQSICQNEEGFYQMKLPFIKEPSLPNNKFAVMKRLTYLKHRLVKKQPYYHDYKNLQCTGYSVLTALKRHGNTANRFNPDFQQMHSFVLLVFALCLSCLCFLLLYFLYFNIFGIKNHVFCEILNFSVFFPNSIKFSVFRITETGEFM